MQRFADSGLKPEKKLEFILCESGESGGFPRRKGRNSCGNCRQKKIKCDEDKPVCNGCRIRGLLCSYDEKVSQPRESVGVPIITNSARALSISTSLIRGQIYNAELSLPTQNLSVLPAKHNLLPINLLQWPVMSNLLPKSFDASTNFMLDLNNVTDDQYIECSRTYTQRPTELDNLLENEFYLVLYDSFLRNTFIWYPIIDIDTIQNLFTSARVKKSYSPIEGALMSSILLLGVESKCHFDKESLKNLQAIKLNLYHLCTDWTFALMRSVSLESVQGVTFIALYELISYNITNAYRLISLAWSNLQLLFISRQNIGQKLYRDMELRCYWSLFTLDSEIRAEFQLAPIGIDILESEIELPLGITANEDTLKKYGGHLIWYFFSTNVAGRRLLNRIHSTIYAQGPLQSLLKPGILISTTDELAYQIEMWRSNLPTILSFRRGEQIQSDYGPDNSSVEELRQLYRLQLCAKYLSSCIIVNRFYLYYILHPFDYAIFDDELVGDLFYRKAMDCAQAELELKIPPTPTNNMSGFIGHINPDGLTINACFARTVSLIAIYLSSRIINIDRDLILHNISEVMRYYETKLIAESKLAWSMYQLLTSMIEKLTTTGANYEITNNA
ncbi:hypothetical protein V1514DRAFT_353760 [Lipomyces japonicus]|uniref:uncharacterized protein n=1 Tax=Lipomyces japonicus TaxID=56871 RepID=UPI0034CEAC9B